MNYCPKCQKKVKTRIDKVNESYRINGEDIEVLADVLVCCECGERLFDEELDNDTLLKAYNEYRIRHKLLFPEDIKDIRKQYGLSQRSFGKLLNWGDKTIHRYENGSLQDKAHNSLLTLLKDPNNMKTYLNENEITLSENKKDSLLKKIEGLSEKQQGSKGVAEQMMRSGPSIENGFKSFDYEKFCAMVLYYADRSKELLKVKLLKLMNYADMLSYRENSVSISGSRYFHYNYGPVPERYEMLLEFMEKDGLIRMEHFEDNGYEKIRIIALDKDPISDLSDDETLILNKVYDRFKDFGSKQIADYSHQEKGYQETKEYQVIPYSYAKDLSID
ncbi:MAG: DUF4065 domain-containing protein [Erysipelotrichaceae bacterium]|nr:DUF4065 domain-containing protein [Erysipelotrichaceae bacterium]